MHAAEGRALFYVVQARAGGCAAPPPANTLVSPTAQPARLRRRPILADQARVHPAKFSFNPGSGQRMRINWPTPDMVM